MCKEGRMVMGRMCDVPRGRMGEGRREERKGVVRRGEKGGGVGSA